MNYIYLLFLSLIIKGIILKYNNDSYLVNFILIFSISYFHSSNYKTSLAISLFYLLITTFFKYMNNKKSNIINGFIFSIVLFYNKEIIKYIKPFIDIINFFSLSYIFLSIFEWMTHKYIMHCDKKSFLYYLLSNIDHSKIIEHTCDTHIEHHKEVRPDMKLTKVSYKNSLFMGWSISIYIFLFVIITLTTSKLITGINYNYITILITGILLTFLWCYLWNKLHPLMHNYSGTYSIKEGPYDSKLNLSYINKLFYRNHENHHLQKGVNKGNYNVIAMGADEWFNTNVINVDNKKYCENPQVAHEEICKN
jgi:hypothetical protein